MSDNNPAKIFFDILSDAVKDGLIPSLDISEEQKKEWIDYCDKEVDENKKGDK